MNPTYKPSLKRVFKGWAANSYDNLGLVVGVSVLSTILIIAFAYSLRLLHHPTVAIPIALLLSPLVVGAFRMAHGIVYRESPAIGDLLDGYRAFLWLSLKWAVINLLIGAILTADTVFFILRSRHQPIWVVPAILSLDVGAFWLATLIYQLPLLIHQRPSVLQVLRRSALLVLDNLWFTGVVFFAIIAFTILCAAPKFVGMALVYFGTAPILCTRATRELLVKYGLADEEPDPNAPMEDDWHLSKHDSG